MIDRLAWSLVVLARLFAVGALIALDVLMWWYWLPFILFGWYHENSPGRAWW